MLEHYKFWNVLTEKNVGVPVKLQGQFDEQPWIATVLKAEYLANPVTKVERPGPPPTEIPATPLHYVAYSIEAGGYGLPPDVQVTNQLGKDQTWKLSKPTMLLAPADKKLDGKPGNPPPGDHFVCYPYGGAPQVLVKPVLLYDQFDRILNQPEEQLEFRLAYLCVPVSKQREGKDVEKIIDAQTHLALYAISQTTLETRAYTKDQFLEQQSLRVTFSEFLGVPSQKKVMTRQ